MPFEATELVRNKGYPDFMDKKGKTYFSKKTLGDLYRHCCAVSVESENLTKDHEFMADECFFVQGYEQYKKEANTVYAAYVRDIQSLMVKFGLKTEAELVLCMPYKWSELFDSNQDSATKALQLSLQVIMKKNRAQFVDSLLPDNEQERRQKAFAWYNVAYADKNCCHSFPWVVLAEDLCNIYAKKIAEPFMVRSSSKEEYRNKWIENGINIEMSCKIGTSALNFLREEKLSLLGCIREKNEIFNRVKTNILDYVTMNHISKISASIEIELFGSVTLFLCDRGSDIDICVCSTETVPMEEDILVGIIKEALNRRVNFRRLSYFFLQKFGPYQALHFVILLIQSVVFIMKACPTKT